MENNLMDKNWQEYDPKWLLELAQQQIPNEIQVIESLKKCTSCFQRSKAYIYFVDGSNPNQKDAAWQFDRNVILEDKKLGTIILDVLEGNKVGGVEFLKYLR